MNLRMHVVYDYEFRAFQVGLPLTQKPLVAVQHLLPGLQPLLPLHHAALHSVLSTQPGLPCAIRSGRPRPHGVVGHPPAPPPDRETASKLRTIAKL